MPRALTLTPEQDADVRRRRRARHSWAAIAVDLGVSYTGLRRRFDEEYRERANAQARKVYRPSSGKRGPKPKTEAPPVIIDRPVAPPQPPHDSLTAELMGDPRPGRSALDRRTSNG